MSIDRKTLVYRGVHRTAKSGDLKKLKIFMRARSIKSSRMCSLYNVFSS